MDGFGNLYGASENYSGWNSMGVAGQCLIRDRKNKVLAASGNESFLRSSKVVQDSQSS